jgi:hypothetical protein
MQAANRRRVGALGTVAGWEAGQVAAVLPKTGVWLTLADSSSSLRAWVSGLTVSAVLQGNGFHVYLKEISKNSP